MMTMQLSAAAQIMQGQLQGKDTRFARVGSDTRTLQTGDLFFALSGPNFDGHDYLAIAAQQGAIAAVVARDMDTVLPTIKVADPLAGLGKLATAWRQQAHAKVIGITGSNGKTTLKEMIASILRQEHSVLATRGNLNNDIGMPLSLLRLQDEAYAVIEMGANHAGEIAYLTHIARPDIALLNNAGRAHLEGFGSLEGVAQAKAEIMQGLSEDGLFVYNADDRFADLWRGLSADYQTATFGVQQTATVHSPADSYRIEWLEQGFVASFDVYTPNDQFKVKLQLAGEHNRLNALAAITACDALGISRQSMVQGLAALVPVDGRLQSITLANGVRVINDTYNANVDSVKAALQVLQAAPGRRTLVLGDLAELGDASESAHAELGKQAQSLGIERLLTCGELSRHAADHFTGDTQHFSQQAQLIDFLRADVAAQDTLLVKGSRAAAMEKVVWALQMGQVDAD
jgi:UDP-N-acetylmuramoyl-tripeptide--D-alanyl-D-alanine ligase